VARDAPRVRRHPRLGPRARQLPPRLRLDAHPLGRCRTSPRSPVSRAVQLYTPGGGVRCLGRRATTPRCEGGVKGGAARSRATGGLQKEQWRVTRRAFVATRA